MEKCPFPFNPETGNPSDEPLVIQPDEVKPGRITLPEEPEESEEGEEDDKPKKEVIIVPDPDKFKEK